MPVVQAPFCLDESAATHDFSNPDRPWRMENDHVRLIPQLADGLHAITQVSILCGGIRKTRIKAPDPLQCSSAVGDVACEEVAETVAANAMLIEDVERRRCDPPLDPHYVWKSVERSHRRLEPPRLGDRIVVCKDHHFPCGVSDPEISCCGWTAAGTLY
jgi:hypothetical protein